MSKEQQYPQVMSLICDNLIADFGDNLSSILLYGSSQTSNKFWDLDILVILKEKDTVLKNLSILKRIYNTYTEHNLDLQLFYTEEVLSPELFSLDAHGSFFTSILSRATTVYGQNPFRNQHVKDISYTTSLLNRIQRYIYQARQEQIGIKRHDKDKNPLYHQKHVRRIILNLMMMFENYDTTSKAEKGFKKRFPNVFNTEDWTTLMSQSDDLNLYIPLYEKVYKVALETASIFLPSSYQKLHRLTINDISLEYILPTSAPSSTAIIVVDGLPRKPELDIFLNLLSSWGYTAFFPRLKGTWESDGNFLDHNPADDIRELAHVLNTGISLSEENIYFKKIIVIGSSFGGLVALNSSIDDAISEVIAFSPVFSMSQVTGVETLSHYIKTNYSGAYRFKQENWDLLVHDNKFSLPSLVKDTAFKSNKCSIITGRHDSQVPFETINSFCIKEDIRLHSLDAGHLSFHKDNHEAIFVLHDILT